ncbi:tripartite tricarboxylate transporter TctB family protein [Alginatibacterium sediminis]|uniref:Tripartite tricarboxylate transporter TctB family protein n=1 Tax=Alginatibacterium sediminis TaxID=2164068 RepID=A0A420EGM9_9ALTE|nr:tripartite tricarboxylate transporter TctB family protein [Alginatibacterium sediminis]
MRSGKLVLAAGFLVLSIFVFILSLQLPPTRNGVPGPATWPVLVSIVMFISAISLGVKEFFKSNETVIKIIGKDQIRVYISMTALFAYLVSMMLIGFSVSTFIMLYGFITWLGNYKWHFRVICALVITTIVYCVFHFVLKVPFRFGILF